MSKAKSAMAGKAELPQRSRSLRLCADDLSYQSMAVEDNGKVIGHEEKRKLREKHGFCLTCVGAPMLCFDINKSRINPLWKGREPRTVDGECFEGICLKCKPEKDPRRQRYAMTKGGSSRSAPSRKDIHRDLSNGSLALSQSRRDLFRASQSRIGRDHSVKREASTTSIGSVGTLGSTTSFGSSNSSFRRQTAAASISSTSSHGRVHMPGSHSPGRRASMIPAATKPTSDIQRSHTGSVSETLHQRRLPFVKPPSQSSISSTECSTSHDDPVCLEDSAMVMAEQAATIRASIAPLSYPLLQPSQSVGSVNSTQSAQVGPSAANNSTLPVTTVSEGSFADGSNNAAVENLRELFDGLTTASNFDIVVDVLTSNIQAEDKEEIKIICLEQIVKLCKGYDDDHLLIGRLIRANIVTDIIFTMKNFSESKAVQMSAAAAITCLAKNQEACEALVESAVCRLLIQTHHNFPDEPAILRTALQALAKIATFAPSALMKDGGCHSLIQIFQEHADDPCTLQATMKVLRTLTCECSAREYFKSADASSHVCTAMSRHVTNMPLQMDGCAFLCNVSIDESSAEVSVVSCEVMQAIVRALQEHRSQTKLVKIACTALQSLTCERRNVQTLAGVEGVFDVFTDDGDSTNKIPDCPEADVVLERLQIALFA